MNHPMSAMSAAGSADEATTMDPGGSHGSTLGVAPDPVEVRRHAGVAATVGGIAAAVAILYLQRATETGALMDWTLTVVMALLSAYWLRSFLDARVPLLVADGQGVRVRLGRSWRGLPWSAVHHVEHVPHTVWWRDGRLIVVPRNEEKVLNELEPGARRQARLAERLYGAPLALPLGLSTRVVGTGGDLGAALAILAERADVVVVEPDLDLIEDDPLADLAEDLAEDLDEPVDSAEPSAEVPGGVVGRLRAARPALAHGLAKVQAIVPTRTLNEARRVDTVIDPDDGSDSDSGDTETLTPLHGRELRVPGRVTLVEEHVPQPLGSDESRVTPIARPGQPVEPLVIEDRSLEPAEDPVIGPEISAARTRLGLSVDALADRTRIRPHVIESIEVDDFEPCGGDFYAKGHLRTLARVLGIAPEPLVADYEERYAHAPINPRRVFEADLAGAGSGLRSGRGGPNWSILVAVVMAVVLAWSVARLVMDSPADLRDSVLPAGSGGIGSTKNVTSDPISVAVTAAGGGARIVVRDGNGRIVFKGNLAVGDSKRVQAVPPVRIESSDGATTVKVGGKERGPLGDAGEAIQRSFTAR